MVVTWWGIYVGGGNHETNWKKFCNLQSPLRCILSEDYSAICFNLTDCNGNQIYNDLAHKGTLAHLAKLALFYFIFLSFLNLFLDKWLSVCLQTKWLWVQVPLVSVKFQISWFVITRDNFTLNAYVAWQSDTQSVVSFTSSFRLHLLKTALMIFYWFWSISLLLEFLDKLCFIFMALILILFFCF